ncbi:MAG: class I SAM-dependent methyltransferase [Ignavibacteriaceae bacterium]
MEWFSDLYDEFRMRTGFGRVPAKETRKDVDFLCDVLKLNEGDKVLDLFCGAGRHSLELAKKGYKVTGIELNPNYLELAKKLCKEKFNTPNFILGDVRKIYYGKGYDAVIIMFSSFGYFSDVEDKLILRKAFNALKPGGRFFMEILNRDWILKNYIKVQDTKVDGIRVVDKRDFDNLTSRNNFIIKRYEKNGVVTKSGSWRLYSAHEIKNILEDIGFRYIAGYSNLKKEPLRTDTRLMRMVFKK